MTDKEQPSQRNQIASAHQRKTSSELLPSRVRLQLDEVMRTGRLSSTILMLEDNERSALEAAIEHSRALVAEDGNPGAAMAMVSKILIAYPSAQMTEAKAAAMSEAYLDALADIPLWAIEAARRRWNRGEVDMLERANLAFAPSAPQLRLLAVDELEEEEGRAKWMDRIIIRDRDARRQSRGMSKEDADELEALRKSQGAIPGEKAARVLPDETRNLIAQLTGNMKYMTMGKDGE